MDFERDIIPALGVSYATALAVICADAQFSTQRSLAHQLLASELAAKVRSGPIDQEHHSLPHPVFADLKLGPTAPGGLFVARRYVLGRNEPWGGVPQAPTGDYNAIVAGVISAATPLVANVAAAMGAPWFRASRHMLYTGAAPGGLFRPDALLEPLDSADVVLSAGTFRIQCEIYLRSESLTPGVAVGFALDLDGSNLATYSLTRGTDPNGREIDQVQYFGTTLDATLAAPKTLTIRNSSAFNEYAIGLLRFWSP
jgi:hypothetical protein